MTVSKTTIANLIQDQLGFSNKQSYELVETLLEIMKKSLESGDDVMVSGFGKFSVKEKKIRKGRNPSTGESMILDARRVVTFKCSGKLKDKVNNKD
jgi:integration host factor subunit alpha